MGRLQPQTRIMTIALLETMRLPFRASTTTVSRHPKPLNARWADRGSPDRYSGILLHISKGNRKKETNIASWEQHDELSSRCKRAYDMSRGILRFLTGELHAWQRDAIAAQSQMLSLDVRTRLLVIPVLDRTKGSRAIIGRDRQKDVRPYCRLSLCNPGSGATVLRDAPWSIVVDLVDDLIPLPLFVEADFIIEPRSRDGV